MSAPRLDPGQDAWLQRRARPAVRRDPAAPGPARLPDAQQISRLVRLGPPVLPAGATARARLAHDRQTEAWTDAWALHYAHLTALFVDA